MFILVLGSTAGLGNFLSSLFAVERTVFDYGKLKGLPESFAFEAGQQALKGEVAATSSDGLAIATFAGGCFWGTELQYMRMRGVVATCVGYTQGTLEQPTYSEVCSGTTGHTEACQIVYDPKRCPYELLCAKLFETIDPTVLNRVGNDVGTQYRHGIYPHTTEQLASARAVVAREQKSRTKPIVTEVKEAAIFWPAEEYHQQYLKKGGQSASKGETERVRCYG